MLTPPTDRLHKFLAIAGLALLLLGLTVPLQRYQEAEFQRIEAVATAREIQYAYARYAKQVNSMIEIYNDAVRKGAGTERSSEAKERILKLDPEAKKLGRETEDLFVQLGKQLDLALHFERVMHLWFAIGVVCFLAGSVLAFYGFRKWFKVAKNEA